MYNLIPAVDVVAMNNDTRRGSTLTVRHDRPVIVAGVFGSGTDTKALCPKRGELGKGLPTVWTKSLIFELHPVELSDDTLSIPTPTAMESYDGLHVVRLHDDAKELKDFLSVLYDSWYAVSFCDYFKI